MESGSKAELCENDIVAVGDTKLDDMGDQDGTSNHHTESMMGMLTSSRWTLAYMCCLCFIMIESMRSSMGIAIVCMVKQPIRDNSKNYTPLCASAGLRDDSNSNNSTDPGGEIEWDKTTQGWVLSAFFYGYLITQVPSGIIAGRYGGKRVVLVSLSLYSVTNMLIPAAARFDGIRYDISAILVITLRVLSGIFCGGVMPSLFNLMGKWVPTYERSKLTVLTVSGQRLGGILILGVGGFFCEWKSFSGGWPSIFYMSGGISILFCFIWSLMVFDSPNQHPRISQREREFIIAHTHYQPSHKTKKHIPWRRIATSPAVWAIIVAHTSYNFGMYAINTKLPAYMSEVLGLDIKSNGLYSALPYIAMVIVGNLASNVIDKLRQGKELSTVAARKMALAIALIVPTGFLIAAGFIPCDKKYLGNVFMTTAVGFTGFANSGFTANIHDIASKYSGEVFGISNMFATVPGIIAPPLVNALTPTGTVEEWRVVFYVWSAIFVFGAVFFTIFARGETQEWTREDKSDTVDQQTEKPKMTVKTKFEI